MIIYRGQKVENSIGFWWTDSLEEAVNFASARGGRSYIVLQAQVPDEWVAQFLRFSTADGCSSNYYRIPLESMQSQWRAVEVHSGRIEVRARGQ